MSQVSSALPPSIAAAHNCGALLRSIAAAHCCGALLLRTAAVHGCRAVPPRVAAETAALQRLSFLGNFGDPWGGGRSPV